MDSGWGIRRRTALMKICPKCGSNDVLQVTSTFGSGRVYQSLQCNDCSVPKRKKPEPEPISLLREARDLLMRSISKPVELEGEVAEWLNKFDEWWET